MGMAQDLYWTHPRCSCFHTVDGCEILHQLVTSGNYKTLQIMGLQWDFAHLLTGAGFPNHPQYVYPRIMIMSPRSTSLHDTSGRHFFRWTVNPQNFIYLNKKPNHGNIIYGNQNNSKSSKMSNQNVKWKCSGEVKRLGTHGPEAVELLRSMTIHDQCGATSSWQPETGDFISIPKDPKKNGLNSPSFLKSPSFHTYFYIDIYRSVSIIYVYIYIYYIYIQKIYMMIYPLVLYIYIQNIIWLFTPGIFLTVIAGCFPMNPSRWIPMNAQRPSRA